MDAIIIFTQEQLDAYTKILINRLSLNQTTTSIPEEISWFDIDQLRAYLPDKPVKATVYSWVHARSIPFYRGTKKLRFLKSEIDEWLKNGRQLTFSEIQFKAEGYLKTSKSNRHGK